MGNAWLNKNEIGDTNGPEFLKAARGYVYHIGLSEEQVAGEVDKNEEAPANVLVLVRTENRGVKRRQTDTIDLKRIKELAALDQQLNNGVVLKVGKLLETSTEFFDKFICSGFTSDLSLVTLMISSSKFKNRSSTR